MSDRALTAAAQTAIDAQVVKPAFLVFLDFPSGAVYSWTGQGTLSHGGNDYLGAGNHLGFSPFPETADSSSQGIEIHLSGVDSDLLSDVIDDSFQSRTCQVDVAFLDSSLNVIADPVILFRGLMDKATVEDDGQRSTITIAAESRLIDLLRIRQWRYTDSDQQLLHPGQGDRGMEFIPTIQNIKIEWGGGG